MRSIRLPESAGPQPGTVVAGRYRLVRPLSSMLPSDVWVAEHRERKQRVAVELLPSSIANDAELVEGFLNEARSAARVAGESVARVLEYGVDTGGHAFVALDLPEGESLETRLLARHRLGPTELTAIVCDAAGALEQAHGFGVIHGSLRPANLFITMSERQTTKLLFSITRIMTDTVELVRRMTGGSSTASGISSSVSSHNVAYMSPEQVLGDEPLDHRTDLWSLAVIAFECLTGTLPFPGNTVGDRLVRICTAAPLLPSGLAALPPGFDGWFLRGVHKSKTQRFDSAREMADSLAALVMS